MGDDFKWHQIISGLWGSKDMIPLHKREPQILVKTTIRELIIYIFFLIIISFTSFSQFSPDYYQFTNVLSTLFQKQDDVTDMYKFWDFLENDVLDALFWEKWYNKGYRRPEISCPDGSLATKPCSMDYKDRNILYENKILGLPRLRQLRVTNDSCYIHHDFREAIPTCYAPYSPYYEDKTPFSPQIRNYTDYEAWTYQNAKRLKDSNYWGLLATYSGGGSVQNLHYSMSHSRLIIEELKNGLWISQATRFVSLDFTVYNANLNLFCIAKLVFEFPATGGVLPSQSFDTIRFIKYTSYDDFVLLAAEIMFVIFIIYYAIEEIIEIKIYKLEYFFKFWNILDIIVLLVSIFQIWMSGYFYIKTQVLLSRLLHRPFIYPEFSSLAYLSRSLKVTMAVNAFVAWIKFLKYLSFNSTMSQLSGTLSTAAKDLSGFSVLFLIVYLAFVQFGYLILGTQLASYKSIMDSFYTLFRMVLGDFNFKEIEETSTFIGVIFFLTYIFFVFFVLLNMFLAIINDTYAIVKSDVDSRASEFRINDFLKCGINNIKGRLGIEDRSMDVENAVKLAVMDDGYITYRELRENLRMSGFSEVEINLYFDRFQRDPEYAAIILDEEEIKMSNCHESRLMSGKEGRKARSALQRERRMSQITDGQMLKPDLFYGLETKVGKLEQCLSPLMKKLDVLLLQMDDLEKNRHRKITKQQMEQIFEMIVHNNQNPEKKAKKNSKHLNK